MIPGPINQLLQVLAVIVTWNSIIMRLLSPFVKHSPSTGLIQLEKVMKQYLFYDFQYALFYDFHNISNYI